MPVCGRGGRGAVQPKRADPETVDQTTGKRPEHQAIYRQIRNMILFGSLVPGEPVTIQGLCERTGAGATPVREAIRRLSAENALEFGENRRVRIPVMTEATLSQIAMARLWVEPRLTNMAAVRTTPEEISQLEAFDTGVDRAIEAGDIQGYLEQNYRFHFCLYDCAQAHVLRRIATSLWLQMGPSLRIVCAKYGTSNLPDMHSQTLDALRRGDPAGASDAITEDIRQGITQVRQSLASLAVSD